MGLTILVLLGLIIVIIFNSRLSKLRERVDSLEWDSQLLSKLSQRVEHLEKELSGGKEPAQILSETGKSPETSPAALPLAKEQSKSTAPVSHDIPIADTKAKTPGQFSSFIQKEKSSFIDIGKIKSRTREEWESFVGGKLLNRIGSLALIIGLGFFLKYAFDNNLISESVRVLIGAAAGGICLGFAYRTHQKGFQIFAQGLVGSGIAILYLSVYASFNFYALVPQWLAFFLMSCVTALSLTFGLRFNSRVIGLFGWAGGFLTPLMLSTGSANEIGLFTYIALLDVGLLAITFAKNDWAIIEPLTLASTWGMYWAWFFKYYHESDFLITVFFISVFWLLFFGLDVARLRWFSKLMTPIHHAVAVANTIIYYPILYFLVNYNHHSWMAGGTIILAGFHAGIFWWLSRRSVLQESVLIRYVLTAIILAFFATAIHFKDFQTVLGWSMEAAALVWCAVRWRKPFIQYAAFALFFFALGKFAATEGAFSSVLIESFQPLLNERCLTFLALTLTLGFTAYFLPKDENIKKYWPAFFHYAWCIVFFVFLTVETNDYFQRQIYISSDSSGDVMIFLRPAALAIVWLLFSIPLIWIRSRQKLIPLIGSAFVLLGISACTLILFGHAFEPLRAYLPVLNIRSAAFILAIGSALFHFRHTKDAQYPQKSVHSSALLYIFSVLLFAFFTIELSDYFRWRMLDQSGELIAQMEFSQPLILSITWTLLAAALFFAGLRHRLTPIIQSAVCVLALAAIAFLFNGLSFHPIWNFFPVFNIRALSLSVLMLGIALHFFLTSKAHPVRDWHRRYSSILLYSFSITAFIFITVEIDDYFQNLIFDHTGIAVEELSFASLMILSASWILLSLAGVWIGLKKRWKEFLYSGLAFLTLGVCTVLIQGFEFSPIELFQCIFNIRFLCGGIAVAVLFIHPLLLGPSDINAPWKQKALSLLQIGMIVLSLALLTGETRDFFQQKIAAAQPADDTLRQLENLMQLSLSSIWLLYSLALMGFGFWRSLRRIRIIAFVLFGFTILKIFIYDLSYLETLYRIFSFIGLGVILIGVSYVYQKYKDIIFGAPVS